MQPSDDIKYLRQREAEEREAAARSRNEVRSAHEKLAAAYASRIASASDTASSQ
jgi:hypothetical protein